MVSHGPKLSLQFYSEPDELDYFLHFHKILSKQFYYQQPIPMDKNLEVFSNMSAEYTGTQIMMTSFQHWTLELLCPQIYLMKSCKLCRSLHIQIQTQLLEFIDDINDHFKVAVSPGNTVCLDESMVKSFQKTFLERWKSNKNQEQLAMSSKPWVIEDQRSYSNGKVQRKGVHETQKTCTWTRCNSSHMFVSHWKLGWFMVQIS